MLIDDSSPHAAETLWLLRHTAASIRQRQPIPDHTRHGLAARNLDDPANRFLLINLSAFLQQPLRLAPPCSSWHSRDEVMLLRAMSALEQGRATHARFALADLVRPRMLSRREIEACCCLLARLSGLSLAGANDRPAAADRARASHGFSP